MLTHRHRALLRVLRGSLFLLSLLTFGWMTVELPRAATQGASQSNTVTTTTSQSSQSSTTDSNLVNQAASKQTNTVDKTNLEKALNSAKALTGHLSDYATISQTLLKTAISNGEILDKSTKFSQTDIDQQTKVINTTIDKMVKRNYDANRYDSVPVGYNNQNQLDTEGAPIQAHGGGVIQTTDPSNGQPIYYWVGEDKSHNNAFFNGINLYSSKDLKNWTYVNTILKPDANNSALFDVIMERPKILYNAKNKQFVVWAHWERQGNYSSSQVAVATSSQAGGEYHFLGHWRPGAGTDSKYRNWGVKLLNSDSKTDTQTTAFYDDGTKLNDYQNVTKDTDNWGTPSRDFTLFQDGSDAYIISTESGTTMRIYKLNADYTDVDKTAMKSYELFTNARREAPAVVKAGDYYVIATSQQSGWSPNQGRYSYTKDITDPNGWKVTTTQNSAGEDINTPFGLLGDNSTYHSQPTNILKVNQNGQTNYIYMGDSWLPSTIGESGYIWLPLKISGLEGNSPQVSMDYTPDWSIDTLSGKLDVPNYPLLSKNKPATSKGGKRC
ncbi:hypothetical protein YK48G_11790 [Lentilactobacillus fungorum]|uniref:Family 43 glycosylhydrolase n=1 Tax=Lentilactobacillus fungorum TaxID=2201250 RepID=A0ABQ3VZI5_9LACO|nr:hypothetical protein [Lentilactobacillus fungorum]GHP13754.1 hypothetical protein YK48G_11790 [Lentilactobacillus fungorum]